MDLEVILAWIFVDYGSKWLVVVELPGDQTDSRRKMVVMEDESEDRVDGVDVRARTVVEGAAAAADGGNKRGIEDMEVMVDVEVRVDRGVMVDTVAHGIEVEMVAKPWEDMGHEAEKIPEMEADGERVDE